MYCIGCGTELPDDANFCLRCGKPQKKGVKIADESVTEAKYETCEIGWDKAGLLSLEFWAKAIGPNGVYNAGEVKFTPGPFRQREYPDNDESNACEALNTLIKQLTQDGWQPLTRGPYWYNYRFQRRVKE
jgi:zinc ribbon protein